MEAVQRALRNATEMTKLYILLALNCGMTQTDIAKLRQDQVDWQAGRIVRKRSKTEHHENTPVVNYKLWAETFRLLKKYRAAKGELVLLNIKGMPLIVEKESPDGKKRYLRNDNIGVAFGKLQRRLKLGPFKLFRKTSSSMLGESNEFARYAQYFLAQAPSTIADAHYVKPSQVQFDAAVKWLGEQFGL